MKQKLTRIAAGPVLLAILFAAAGPATAQQNTTPAEPVTLQYEWTLDQEVVYNPSKISYVKGYIILTDGNPDHQIAVFRETDRQFLGGFGRQGRGPSEFLSPYLLLSKPDDPLFCVYDLNMRRISCYDVDRTVTDFTRPEPELMVTLDGNFGMPINLDARISRREFIVTGIFSDETRYIIADSTGKVIQRAGTIPDIMDNVPINVQHNAALTRVAAHPVNGRLALAYRFRNRISIYSPEGELIRDIDHPPLQDGDPGLILAHTPSGQPYMAQGNDTRMYYINIMADDKRIYALYSGRQRKEGAATYAQYLYIYNWDGDLLSYKRFDTFVESCTLTEEPDVILCVKGSPDVEEDFTIRKYHLASN